MDSDGWRTDAVVSAERPAAGGIYVPFGPHSACVVQVDRGDGSGDGFTEQGWRTGCGQDLDLLWPDREYDREDRADLGSRPQSRCARHDWGGVNRVAFGMYAAWYTANPGDGHDNYWPYGMRWPMVSPFTP